MFILLFFILYKVNEVYNCIFYKFKGFIFEFVDFFFDVISYECF